LIYTPSKKGGLSFGVFDCFLQNEVVLKFRCHKSKNKNGVLWSQARMRFEIRLRCYLVIGNLQLVIGNRQLAIGNWQ